MELHRVEKHTGIHTVVSQDICRMLISMMSRDWMQEHMCTQKMDCPICDACIVWHQLSLDLVEYVTQEHPAHPPDVSIYIVWHQLTFKIMKYVLI